MINAQTPNKIDCAALKQKIEDVFKNTTSIRIGYSSRERELYVDYEQDTALNSHLVVRNSGKKLVRQILIDVKGEKYFATDKMNLPDANVWEHKIPKSFNEKGWIDSCKSANAVFNLPFNNCFLSKEQMITGTPFTIYSIDIANDTFDIWLNKTTDKLERITGQNKLKAIKFEWLFDVPFKVTPPKYLDDAPKYGMNMFPPSYSYDEFDGNERVFIAVDKNAEYKDGQMAMFKFLGNNVKYPSDARERNKQGTVYIGFVIEKDGTLTNFKLKRGFAEDCNAEAMRVTKAMSGDWEAGIFNGQKVRQVFTLPIKFKLE